MSSFSFSKANARVYFLTKDYCFFALLDFPFPEINASKVAEHVSLQSMDLSAHSSILVLFLGFAGVTGINLELDNFEVEMGKNKVFDVERLSKLLNLSEYLHC